MENDLGKRYDFKESEPRIYSLWEQSGYFSPDAAPEEAVPYVILLPPPNITGSLHMGHALNASLSDVLIRYHRMRGRKTVWFPGIDHAGIATQNVVERQLKKEGKTRWDLGREAFIERVWQWKEQYGSIILEQFKRLGVSCDWSRLRFTMDKAYADEVKKAFIHYHQRGWIYRGTRVINWCPRCRTSLSDLEVEHEEAQETLWYISYPLKEKEGTITVATVRPETMLGDAAVAVHPDDTRYKDLVGLHAILPIVGREIPILADSAIEKDFGTGAVKVTPAHDILDAEIGERHHLPLYQVIGEDGKMTKEAGADYQGLSVKDAREKVLARLKELGVLTKEETYTHNLAVCSRCHHILEPIPSKQWFLKMEELARAALDAVDRKQVRILPENFAKPYRDWLEHIRDWCISRQIWWGHRLPVY
ncbi:valine--tRNA ligase, partial [Candidatus Parcubacteria bacterium]